MRTPKPIPNQSLATRLFKDFLPGIGIRIHSRLHAWCSVIILFLSMGCKTGFNQYDAPIRFEEGTKFPRTIECGGSFKVSYSVANNDKYLLLASRIANIGNCKVDLNLIFTQKDGKVLSERAVELAGLDSVFVDVPQGASTCTAQYRCTGGGNGGCRIESVRLHQAGNTYEAPSLTVVSEMGPSGGQADGIFVGSGAVKCGDSGRKVVRISNASKTKDDFLYIRVVMTQEGKCPMDVYFDRTLAVKTTEKGSTVNTTSWNGGKTKGGGEDFRLGPGKGVDVLLTCGKEKGSDTCTGSLKVLISSQILK